ncbi:hypothetical protein D4764_17G0005070 [Takifugu flavidus]|uniref:Uncharacterized protein n=1 Tax=Takifugu flavidus TaxID=433684 RepID=A0A5C6NU58_9TELE|nr:hypothetical protein D4764_17G0005070 [Takifugu flavidus]
MWRRVGEGCGVESRTGAAARGRAASPAAHLAAPVGPQCAAFLLTHHLHAGPIVFKCLHLNRAAFQSTLPQLTFTTVRRICIRSVSQRYLMGRAKEGGSVGPQLPSVNNGSPQAPRPGASQS